MKKLLFFITLFFLVSCNKESSSKSESPRYEIPTHLLGNNWVRSIDGSGPDDWFEGLILSKENFFVVVYSKNDNDEITAISNESNYYIEVVSDNKFIATNTDNPLDILEVEYTIIENLLEVCIDGDCNDYYALGPGDL